MPSTKIRTYCTNPLRNFSSLVVKIASPFLGLHFIAVYYQFVLYKNSTDLVLKIIV